MPKRKIKIGLDFHGVLNTHLRYFKEFVDEALRRGHEIHIISGGSTGDIQSTLRGLGIGYTHIFSILDFYTRLGKVVFFDSGGFLIADDLWFSAKGRYCKKAKIDILIDDQIEFNSNGIEHFCLFDKYKEVCTIGRLKFDFSEDPSETLDEIEKIVG